MTDRQHMLDAMIITLSGIHPWEKKRRLKALKEIEALAKQITKDNEDIQRETKRPKVAKNAPKNT